MIILKKAILGVILLLSTSTVAHAVQVIELENQKGQLSEALGRSLGKGFSEGMERAREKAILDEILKDYEPSKNSTFVLKVLQSELSPRTKEMVMNALNEQHKMYLYERATQ